jgi:hypothetical protein
MRVNELLQEATELSKLGFSRTFVRAAFKDTYIKHNAQFKEATKKDLKLDNIYGSLVVASTKNGEVALVGSTKEIYVGGKSAPGLYVITVKDGKVSEEAMKTAKALALIPAGSKIYMANLVSVTYGGRQRQKSDLDREAKERDNYQFLKYMQETYGPALQREAEAAMDFIFKGLRHLDKRTRPMNGLPTEAERALSYAGFIEEVAENGFSKKAAENWYGAESGFGSHYINIDKFFEAMKQPAAAAKLAKTIFKKIREAKAVVQDMLKARMKQKLDKLSTKE